VTVRCPCPPTGTPIAPRPCVFIWPAGSGSVSPCSPITADGTPQGADLIDWVRRTEGVGVGEAIRLLDSRSTFTNAWAGHATEYRRAPTAAADWEAPILERTPSERVSEVLRAAWETYTTGQLHLQGVHYLASRRIAVTVLERRTGRPEVGHTCPGRDDLVGALQARGFTDDELVDAGLAGRRLHERRITDFYRQRVLIPIRSADGQITGLVGRNVGDTRYSKYKLAPHPSLRQVGQRG
jgi:DNA primase